MGDNIIHSSFQSVFQLKGYSNLHELLLGKAKEHEENGKQKWITDSLTGESYTFSQLDDLSRRVASWLYKRGLRPKDIVIFMEIDIVKQPLFLTGVWRANGICRASYPEDTEDTLFERVEESRAGWIYCESSHVEMCLRVAERIYWDVELIVTSSLDSVPPGCTSIYELLQDDGSELPESKTGWKDTALIMCTSGTTGNSKGAVITQSATAWQILNTAMGIPFFKDDGVKLILTKSTHISGVISTFGSLVSGAHSVYLTLISRNTLLQVVGKYKPYFIFGFPTFLLMLVNDPSAAELDLTNLECIGGGGAPVTDAMTQALMTLPSMKHIVNTYGLTECAPVITTVDFDNQCPIPDCPPGCIGKLVPGTSAKFVNTETGEANGPGEIGELYIKCSGLFKEYYMKPEATQKAFDGEFFFKTGDVGYYDEQGFIFLVDRAKDIFKYFNNHVSPTEIENIILAHPAIGEVCVVGISDPDGGGHIPRAFCVAVGDHDVTTEEILEYANAQLASYKHLRGGVYFVPELPKGKTGKVTRQLVEQIDVHEL